MSRLNQLANQLASTAVAALVLVSCNSGETAIAEEPQQQQQTIQQDLGVIAEDPDQRGDVDLRLGEVQIVRGVRVSCGNDRDGWRDHDHDRDRDRDHGGGRDPRQSDSREYLQLNDAALVQIAMSRGVGRCRIERTFGRGSNFFFISVGGYQVSTFESYAERLLPELRDKIRKGGC